jgi:DNA-binding response OmpR family regulator
MACVLVIDDESTVGVILRLAFGVRGHTTIWAQDGRTGIEMARTEDPNAIVLDMMMPGLSGYDVLGQLRKNVELQSVPVLVLTAITLSRELQRCLSEGADAVMTKPFDPLDVANAIDRLLSVQPGTRVESGRLEVNRFRPE